MGRLIMGFVFMAMVIMILDEVFHVMPNSALGFVVISLAAFGLGSWLWDKFTDYED